MYICTDGSGGPALTVLYRRGFVQGGDNTTRSRFNVRIWKPVLNNNTLLNYLNKEHSRTFPRKTKSMKKKFCFLGTLRFQYIRMMCLYLPGVAILHTRTDTSLSWAQYIRYKIWSLQSKHYFSFILEFESRDHYL